MASIKTNNVQITYTTSSTNDTTTISFTPAAAGNPSYKNSKVIRLKLGSETIASATAQSTDVNNLKMAINTFFAALNAAGAKSITRGHSNETRTLQLSVFGQTASANITINARPSYSVSYNANGGSGAPGGQTKWYGENLTLQSGEPTRTNYVFKNWNTKADGSGTTYNKGATYTANAAITLYAQWYPPYTITYNANGGAGAPGNQTKIYNTTLKLTTAKPTRAGWTFKEWNTVAGGTGTPYPSGSNYIANAAATLYAQWIRAISSVTIGSVDAKRVDDPSSTTESDEGTYAYLEIPYIVKGAAAADVSITATATAASGSAPTVTIDSDTATKVQDNDLIGTFIIRAGVCDIDVEYVFDITITAKNTSATQNDVIARRTVRLSTAFFTIDVLAGGHGIAFGKAAKTEDLFECEFPAQFNDVLNVKVNIEMGLDTTEVPGTIDGDLYAAITALGWESEVID